MEDTENKRREYFRKYMHDRYHKDPNKARAYKNTLRLKKQTNIEEEDVKKFGVYLADVLRIKKMLERIPENFRREILPR